MIVIIQACIQDGTAQPQEETKDGPTAGGQPPVESRKVQAVINNLYQLVLRFSKEKAEIADKDAAKQEYLNQKIRMARDQIVLLQKQASYLRGDDAHEMHEEIKKKTHAQNSTLVQLEAIRKAQKDKIGSLARTFC